MRLYATHRLVLATSLLVLAVLAACAAAPPEPTAAAPTTDDEKTLYALGLALAANLQPFALTEAELAFVQAGLTDGVLDREPAVALQEYAPRIQQLGQARAQAAAQTERAAATGFLDQASAEPDALTTDSGLVYTELVAGSGATPTASDRVRVSYHGTLRDGTVFDSSRDRGQPVEFALPQVIPCWQEGLQRMKAGGKAKFVCPPDLAYGDQGAPPRIPGGSVLVFEVELLEVTTAGS